MTLMQSNYEILKKGDKAPNFELRDTNNEIQSLQTLKGEKGTLIIFMCNHCPYVIPKFDEINRITDEFKNKGISVIAINSNNNDAYPDDSFENMQKLKNKYPFLFYYLFDETQEISRLYGAVCTPDPYLFNKDLELVYHGRFDSHHMDVPQEDNELYDVVKELLEKGEVTKQEIPSQGCSIKWNNSNTN